LLVATATLIPLTLVAPTAKAALRNRYSFTTDATDSIGGQNGTLFGTNGSFSGGQLVLANTGQGSQNPGSDGAYLDLPNGLISNASAAGTPGVVSVEMWITMQQNRDWAAAFSAGNSINGEGTSDCCNDDQPYVQIIPRSGDGGQGNDFRVTTNSYGGAEGWVDDAGGGDGTDLTVGRKEHVVAVFDQSAGTPGNVTVYRNGTLMGTSPMAANLNLNTFKRADNSGGDVNIWLGKSQWPDSLVAASYDEFRVYSHALSANEALSDAVYGPDIVGTATVPTIEVNKSTGAVTLKNNEAFPVKLDYYSITSQAGALKTNTWSSLDDQNYNAVDGPDAGSIAGDSGGEGWDKAGGSNANQLIELFLSSVGSTLAPNATLSLGNAYNTATFGGANGDLVFKFGVANGGLITAPVNYITTALAGDYNHNGVVDAADYVLWRKTLNQTGAGLPADGNNNGTVDQADYNIWRTNFGRPPGSGASTGIAASVPEPTTLVLMVLSSLCICGWRGHRLVSDARGDC
jgi:hypothetical protein